jgi:hypothetical protein
VTIIGERVPGWQQIRMLRPPLVISALLAWRASECAAAEIQPPGIS